MRLGKLVTLIVFYLVAILVATELFSRFALGLKPLLYSRPYDPLFVSGDFVGAASRESLLNVATNSPAINHYTRTEIGFFVWTGQFPPTSSSNLADFLFSNYLSRYSSRDMDLILCSKPTALSVFILGGSLAVGSSASSKLTTWHALLEKELRKGLSRNDVYVFNGAMGAFLSTQERLAYHFAVSLRPAKVVIILNGFNDLFAPVASGTRPGDPFQLPARYTQAYGSPLILWLAESSAIVNYFLQANVLRSITQLQDRMAQDDGAFNAYADAVVSLYLENMAAVLRDCQAQGLPCLVAVQPSRALSETELGAPTYSGFVLPSHRVLQLYELLRKRIHASGYATHFIDLTRIIKSSNELAYYTDSVHLDDRGQRLIADALFPAALEAAKGAQSSRDSIFNCDRILPKEIEQLSLLGVASANNGAVTQISNGILLTADPRQWSYSASLPIDQIGQRAGQNVFLKVTLGSMDGEIGLALLPDIAAKNVLYEKPLTPDSADTDVYIPLPSGLDRAVLVFRKQSTDGQPSHVQVRHILIVRTD
jgi:lysophospholipase L1-like esterase